MAAAALHALPPINLNLDLSNLNADCCNGCCTTCSCCQTTIDLKDVRVVATGPNEVSIERPAGWGASCCQAIYAFFCCCCFTPPPVSNYAEGKRLYEQSLVQRLGGATGKQVALNYVNMADLSDHEHLNGEDVQKLEQAVGDLKGHMENLDKMVTTLRLSTASEQAQGKEIAKKPVAEDQLQAVKIVKRGKSENFQEAQLRDDLKKLPLQRPLEATQIEQIVKGVKEAIQAHQSNLVNSAFIRMVVAKELDQLGIQISRDAMPIKGTPPKDLLEAIQKKNLESLNKKELQALLACIGQEVVKGKPTAKAEQEKKEQGA